MTPELGKGRTGLSQRDGATVDYLRGGASKRIAHDVLEALIIGCDAHQVARADLHRSHPSRHRNPETWVIMEEKM